MRFFVDAEPPHPRAELCCLLRLCCLRVAVCFSTQDLRGNIRVFCRVRPMLPHEYVEAGTSPAPGPMGPFAAKQGVLNCVPWNHRCVLSSCGASCLPCGGRCWGLIARARVNSRGGERK